MVTPKITIQRKPIIITNWYEYDIRIVDPPPTHGFAVVRIDPLSCYKATPQYELAKSLGVDDDDITVYIDRFAPHGSRYSYGDYPHTRKGVAAKVLTQIMRDAFADGAKAVHAASRETFMQRFMKKQGCIHTPGYKGEHYCKLILPEEF